jgi:hypothetical protein
MRISIVPILGGLNSMSNIWKFSSQETYDVSVTKTDQLMLIRETVTVYCEIRMKHVRVYTLREQKVDF